MVENLKQFMLKDNSCRNTVSIKYRDVFSGSYAAVLIAIMFNEVNKEWEVLLTKRSSLLASFPSLTVFPGG